MCILSVSPNQNNPSLQPRQGKILGVPLNWTMAASFHILSSESPFTIIQSSHAASVRIIQNCLFYTCTEVCKHRHILESCLNYCVSFVSLCGMN